MRYAWVLLLATLACDGRACDVPTAPDARHLGSTGDPCVTLWDCRPGYTCSAGSCARAPDDPYRDCYYDWQCDWDESCINDQCVSTPWPDASVPWPDAAWPDAGDADALDSDAGAADAGAADALSLTARLLPHGLRPTTEPACSTFSLVGIDWDGHAFEFDVPSNTMLRTGERVSRPIEASATVASPDALFFRRRESAAATTTSTAPPFRCVRSEGNDCCFQCSDPGTEFRFEALARVIGGTGPFIDPTG